MFDFGLPAFMDVLEQSRRQTLMDLSKRNTFRDGETIHETGEEATYTGWVESGYLLFGKYLQNEGFHSLARLGPGHHFGEFAAMDIRPNTRPMRRLAAVSDGETAVRRIDASELREVFRNDPEYYRAFHLVTSARLSLLLELYDDARRLPAKQRIINFLEIMHRHQADDEAVDCTQADISRLLGLSKVTVNQTLRGLTDQGVISLGYGRIRFVEPDRLRALADRV